MALDRLATHLRGDLYGGVTSAVVALPLAMAFGVASGLGAMAGIWGAIAVGFFAAILGGTPSQVSGPTGPMTVVMGAIVASHAGTPAEAFAIVALGGALQVAFGLMRIGQYVSYTPYPVVSGFMSGIGAIIIVIEVLPLFGLPAALGGPTGAIAGWATIPEGMVWQAALLGGVSLATMVLWPREWRRVLPPPLAALILGTALALAAFPEAPVIGEVPTGLPPLAFPAVGLPDLPGLVQPALILALLGSIDSLLTSLVADSVTHTRHDPNRELIGQGIGNMAASLIGGLPGAGATMRTVVNVRAGGRTPVSGALHSVILLALVLGLAPLAEAIPHAVLAGILMKVGWDIIDWGYLARIRRAPRDKVVVMLVTLGLTVFADLVTAVAVGLILAGFVTARWMEGEELKGVTALALSPGAGPLTPEERALLAPHGPRIGFVQLRGRFSYASAREITRVATRGMTGARAMIYDFTHAARVDTSAALAIDELFCRARKHGPVLTVGLSGPVAETLAALGVLEHVPAENRLQTRAEAIAAAERLLEQATG